MFKKWLLVLGLVAVAHPVAAQSNCNVEHVLKPGDSLLSVAEEYYGDRSRWSAIYYANEVALSGNLVDVPVGVSLKIPCLETTSKPDPKPLLQESGGMKLVTGSNYAPFTDLDWSGHGMATELVNAALEEAPAPVPFSITWENDWSKHLFPMLDSKQFDMGFPWIKPDCAADPKNERCVNFHFSDPIFKILVLLYTRADGSLAFDKDSDIHGKTICRPNGYFTHDLDRADRQWLSKELITLEQAESPEACFNLLMQGKVDAVTVNEFLGYRKIQELGLDEKVVPFERPMSTETLHMIISKRHWRGTTLMYRFNAGLENLKKSQRYEEIVSRHLGIFWGN